MRILVDVQFDNEVMLGIMTEEGPRGALVMCMEESGKEHFTLRNPVWISMENIINSYDSKTTLDMLGYKKCADNLYIFEEDTIEDRNYSPPLVEESSVSESLCSDDSLN